MAKIVLVCRNEPDRLVLEHPSVTIPPPNLWIGNEPNKDWSCWSFTIARIPILMESPRDDRRSIEAPTALLETPRESAHDGEPTLRLMVFTSRVLTGSTVLMVALALINYFMIDGFTIATFDSATSDEEHRLERLKRYNTYSAAVSSALSMPFQQFTTALLPVFFLCFMTKATMSPQKAFLVQWLPVLALAGVTWVLSQGLNALNVQFDAPEVEFIMSRTDLVSSDVKVFPLEVTSITDTSTLAGVASTDTILRSAIRPSSSNSKTTCMNDGGALSEDLEASVRYGFPLSSWIDTFMNASVASDESLSFSLSDDFSSQEISESKLINGSANATAVLFTYAFWTLCVHFNCPSLSNLLPLYESVKSSNAAGLLSNIQKAFTASTELSSDTSSSLFPWLNISLPEASVEFSTIDLSPQIAFESVTFDLPVKNESMKYLLSIEGNGTDWTSHFGTQYGCNDNACILQSLIQTRLNNDQVRLLRLCMNQENSTDDDLTAFQVPSYSDSNTCQFPSNTSALIYSFAQHISIDEVNINVTDSLQNIYFKNPRRTYRVTVGRLTWKTVDLAEHYGAACNVNSCNGLYFPLAGGTQHAVVGESYLPSPNSIVEPSKYTMWQALAIAESEISTTNQGDVIYPPNYKFAAGSLPWTTLTGYNCSYQGSDFLNDLVQRHVYSKDPLQPAYTAGLFWLFQDATVKDIQSKKAPGVRLAFDSNIEWISARVSAPKASAIITIAGCALVLILGLLVTYWSGNPQRHSTLSSSLSAQDVAGIRVDTNSFPTTLVHASFQLNGSQKHQPISVTDLQDFVISGITLRHKTDEAIGEVTIVSKNPLGDNQV